MLQNGVYGFRLSGDCSQQKIFRNTHEAMEKAMKKAIHILRDKE